MFNSLIFLFLLNRKSSDGTPKMASTCMQCIVMDLRKQVRRVGNNKTKNGFKLMLSHLLIAVLTAQTSSQSNNNSSNMFNIAGPKSPQLTGGDVAARIEKNSNRIHL